MPRSSRATAPAGLTAAPDPSKRLGRSSRRGLCPRPPDGHSALEGRSDHRSCAGRTDSADLCAARPADPELRAVIPRRMDALRGPRTRAGRGRSEDQRGSRAPHRRATQRLLDQGRRSLGDEEDYPAAFALWIAEVTVGRYRDSKRSSERSWRKGFLSKATSRRRTRRGAC
jgi:hypothetical protein